METQVPKSPLKKVIIQTLAETTSQDQAERLAKRRLRYSSKTREELVEELTRNYDPGVAGAANYLRLI